MSVIGRRASNRTVRHGPEAGRASATRPSYENPDRLVQPEAFDLFRERPTLMRSVAVSALSTGTQPESRRERDRVFREKVEDAAGRLPDAEARKASAVVRYLANSLAWVVLTDQLGLDEEDVGDAVAWAVETLVADLRRRSREGIETLTGNRDEEER